jgi:hypothetical protein
MMPAGVLEALKTERLEAEEYVIVSPSFLWYRRIHRLVFSNLHQRHVGWLLNKLLVGIRQDRIKKWSLQGRDYRWCLLVCEPPWLHQWPRWKSCQLFHRYHGHGCEIHHVYRWKDLVINWLNSWPTHCRCLGDLNPHWCIVGDTSSTLPLVESTWPAGTTCPRPLTTWSVWSKLSEPGCYDCQQGKGFDDHPLGLWKILDCEFT